MATLNPSDYLGYSQLPSGGFGQLDSFGGGSFSGTAGASGSWDAPTLGPATTTTKTTVTTPTPTPTAQPQPSGGDIWSKIAPAYSGWSQQNALADFNSAYGGDINRLYAAKGIPTGNTNAELDQLYNGTLAALGDVENSLRGQASSNIQNVNEQSDRSKSALQQALDRANGLYGNQLTDLANQKRSLDAESVRNYNALRQQTLSRFGMSSSAGGALSELVAQEFTRTSGDLRSKYLSGVNVINQARDDSEGMYMTNLSEIEGQRTAAIRDINSNLSSALAEVSMKRGAVEDEKRAARVDLLNQSIQMARQLQANYEGKLFDLAVWKIQRNSELGIAQKSLDTLVQDVMSRTQNIGTSMNGSIGTSSIGQSTLPWLSNINRANTNNDLYSNLIY